ncbi:hypothetical protein OHS59_19735 [Streptomyces sp. NBC_00414]|uniref:hypothetical protein n=1 Tax=Streptomyces sp. NBC_00414 TaxID=2975739 RepID=UPI002E1BB8D5
MSRRVAGTAVVVLLFGGGAEGCGTGTEGGSVAEEAPEVTPAEAVAKAAENTADITSLRYRVTGTLPKTGRLKVEASMSTAPSAMSMEMIAVDRPQAPRTVVRYVDSTLYVSGSAVDLTKLDGKRWFSAAPAMWGRYSVDNNTYRVLPHQIEGSPIVQSTILTGSRHPRKVGTETVDGTRTTHYRGTVTVAGLQAARDAAVDKKSRERQIKSLDQFIGLGLDKALTMDLWIDEDDRAKRFRLRGATYEARFSADGKPLKPVVGKPLDMTFTLLEINQPVAVKAPSAKETADLGASADAQAG